MQKINTSRSLLALGAIGLAILPLSGAAEAKKNKDKGGPPDYAPAYGRRDRDRDYNRNRDNDDVRYGNYGRTVTLEGLVTDANDSDRNGTNNFRVQAGGRSFDVSSDQNVRVRQGQRVILRGSFDNDNDFKATRVTVTGRANDNRNDNDPYGNDYRPGGDGRVNFPGVVTRVLSGGELEVRAENGRTYRVDPRSNASEYQVGNRIRVSGTTSGSNRVENARITFQNGGVVGPNNGNYGNNGNVYDGGLFGNRPNYGNGSYGNGSYGNSTTQNVNFAARILSINTSRRTAVVRGENGRQYTVRGEDLKNYRSGERVRVRGTARNGTIELSGIDHIK